MGIPSIRSRADSSRFSIVSHEAINYRDAPTVVPRRDEFGLAPNLVPLSAIRLGVEAAPGRYSSARFIATLRELALERREEALDDPVVPAVAAPAHAARDAMRREEAPVIVISVLRPHAGSDITDKTPFYAASCS